jgi:hypothetical protein
MLWTYVPGKANYLPDYLSRMPEDKIPPLPMDAVDPHDGVNACGPVYDAIVKASATDMVVDFVSQCVQYGWPRTRNKYPPIARFLYSFHHTLGKLNGVIMDTHNQIYVPEACKEVVLRELHIGHPGKVAMHNRAKRLFFGSMYTMT